MIPITDYTTLEDRYNRRYQATSAHETLFRISCDDDIFYCSDNHGSDVYYVVEQLAEWHEVRPENIAVRGLDLDSFAAHVTVIEDELRAYGITDPDVIKDKIEQALVVGPDPDIRSDAFWEALDRFTDKRGGEQ